MELANNNVEMLPLNQLAAKGFAIENKLVWRCDGSGLKYLFKAGLQWLERHKDVVNSLNVFPVPDGDTGTNMVLTLRSAITEADQVAQTEAGAVAAALSHGALMGARGNSGVILSQFLAGISKGLADDDNVTVDVLADAVERGALEAYQSVVEPVEGTILTVARAASEAARQSAQQIDRDLVGLWADMVTAMIEAQASTPELLPVLKEAGVPDSGGQGLLYIFEGALRFLEGQPLEIDSVEQESLTFRPRLNLVEKDYGYDVQFIINNHSLDVDKIKAVVDTMGWSTVVVGDVETVKVHLHTDHPQAAIDYGATLGSVSDVVVEDLSAQARSFIAGSAIEELDADVAILAVVAGEGLIKIFEGLGVGKIVKGGQTINPSVQQFLIAIEQLKANNILILPNNPNIILTAQQVQKLSQKEIAVLPTTTVPQGIAAALAFNPQLDGEVNARRMGEAARQLCTVEITGAVRNSTVNGFKINRGDVIGLIDGQITKVGSNDLDVILASLDRLELENYELVSVYVGQDRSRQQTDKIVDKIGELYPNLDIEIYDGGQPHSYYIISVE